MSTRDHMNRNFCMDAGDDKQIVITVKDAAGQAVNVNGFTPDWGLFRISDGFRLVTKSGAGQAEVTDASGGVITVTLAASDTESLSGVYQHQLDVEDTSGNNATVAGGTLTIEPKRT